MIDEFLPLIEQARIDGAVIVLKWDGERAGNHCTVVVTRHDTDFVWRQDSGDMQASLKQALEEYRAKHEA